MKSDQRWSSLEMFGDALIVTTALLKLPTCTDTLRVNMFQPQSILVNIVVKFSKESITTHPICLPAIEWNKIIL